MRVRSDEPFILEIADDGEVVSAVREVSIPAEAPSDGVYVRTNGGWERIYSGDQIAVSGTATGDTVIATLSYPQNTDPDLLRVTLLMRTDSGPGNSGVIILDGAVSRGTGSVVENSISRRADNIARRQDVALVPGASTVDVVFEANIAPLQYRAVIKRLRWEDVS